MELSSGTVNGGDAPALIDLVSADAGGGQSAINMTSANVVQVQALVINGQNIAVPQTTPAAPTAAPTTYNQTWGIDITSVLNMIISKLGNAGIW